MEHATELYDLMQSCAQKSMQLLTQMKQQPEQLAKLVDSLRNYHALLAVVLKNPQHLNDLQSTYWQAAQGLLHNQCQHWLDGQSMPINDKRFRDEAWVNNPFFNLLSQHYLLASNHFNAWLAQLEIEDINLAKRVQFFSRQYLDALSPDNFLYTNPQVIAETIQSQGKNLLRGLENVLIDLEAAASGLPIKTTDVDAFNIGETIAITPGKVIFNNDLMELIQYTPATVNVHAIPLLIIPPWINKYYILDLSPHNSLIRWLVSQGITVFIISWINPDASHANKDLYDYLNEGPMAAITIIKAQLQVKRVNALGFCLGGTLLALLLAYNKAHQVNSVRSATFLASMIDFSDPGDMAVYIDEEQIAAIEKRMQINGYLEGHFMASAFNSLRASDLIWSLFIKKYLHGQAPAAFDILYWNADSTNMPAKMHSEYLRWMYLHNDLVKPGKIRLNNTPIDISRIDTPTFFVATQKDHIAPWKTTYLGFQLMGGKKRFLLGGSGHIAGIIIPPGNDKYGFYRNIGQPKNPEDWLADAHVHTGSWWPEWFAWLKKESGRLIKAPDFAALPIQAIMDAPGSYVHQRYDI